MSFRSHNKKDKTMANIKNLRERIQSWYPEQTLTEYELNEISTRLVDFFLLGAKVAHRIKSAENSHKIETNHYNPQKTTA
jgi:hypothetical protein